MVYEVVLGMACMNKTSGLHPLHLFPSICVAATAMICQLTLQTWLNTVRTLGKSDPLILQQSLPMSRVGLFVLQHPTPDLVSIIWCNIIKFDTVIFLRRFHSSEKSNKGEYRFFLIHLQHNQLQLGGKVVGYHLHRRELQQSYMIMHLYFELPIPSRLAAVCLGLTFSIKERGELFWLPETSIEGPTD